MSVVFTAGAFDDHEEVVFCRDTKTDLRAIIAVHNTTLGPSLGGCRMWPYASEDDALTDALRLSRGMTYKSAMAGLALGGGKSVILGDPRADKTPALMEAMGGFVERLGGRYIVAEDSGTGVEDIEAMGRRTRHVAGVQAKEDEAGTPRSGDPSPSTALGVFCGIEAAVRYRMKRNSLHGVRVAIQGMGNVGRSLARRLAAAGATLQVADIFERNLEGVEDTLGATIVAPEDILAADADVLAPCALGAVLNDETVGTIRAGIVAGAANNQLAEDRHGDALRQRGILYAPDYVINAGGVIDAAMDMTGFDRHALLAKLRGIGDTLTEVFIEAEARGVSTHVVADRIAEARFERLH